ncbi:MAG TPA: glycosyltransferase family 4 protein [Gammaproteobacteria bacterium]|jgi:glycosyltransferase involved in cell wall biosynthesis
MATEIQPLPRDERPVRTLCITAHPDRPEAETFIGLAGRGFEMRVLCAPGASERERIRAAGIEVAPLEIARRIDRAAIARIEAELDASRPDVLHLFNNTALSNGLIAARRRPCKIIAYRGIVGNVSYWNPASWLRHLNPRIDRIVCVAEAVRVSLAEVRLLGLRIPPHKLITIYKGHDPVWYEAGRIDRESLGLPRDAFVVGCVANWRPRKGIEVLLRACERLASDSSLHLVLVGRMDDPAFLALIERSPMTGRIHRLGFRADAARVAAAFDVAVLPSLRREGLPKTVIEAMACGVPPVVTAVGGSPELVVAGKSGLVVPPGDAAVLAEAIRKLRASAELRKAMGAAARERIRAAFPIEATVAQTAALYLDVMRA